MDVFRVVGFRSDSIFSFVEHLNNTNNEGYITNKATFKNKCFHYVYVDDALELWTQYLPEDDNSKYLYFSMTDGRMHEIENVEEDKDVNSSSHQIFKFNLCGVSYPIFAEFPKGCIPEIKKGEKYSITFAGAASVVTLYENQDAFENDFGDISVRSIAPTVVYSVDADPKTVAGVHINGYIKDFEKRKNSYTGDTYYRIVISSFQYDYVVYADECDVDPKIAKNDIISVVTRMFARFEFDDPVEYDLRWTSDSDYEYFSTVITPALISLKPIFFNFLILEFDKETSIDNIEFIQTIIDRSDGKYIVELKKNIDGVQALYRIEKLEWNEVLKVFYNLCINKQAPDLSNWEDVSAQIFREPRVDPQQDDNNSTIDSLIDEIVSLCIEKNMTDEEVILVCSFPCDEKGIDKYGEIEALKVTISALRTFEEKETCLRAIYSLFND